MEIKQKYHEIKLDNQDIDIKKIREFLDYLKEDYQTFRKELEVADNDWKLVLSKNNEEKKNKVLFNPEKTLIRSPITIIDAPWGMGKTYFIEELGRLFIKGELEDYDYFDNVIIKDTWKFCNYDDVVNTIVNELAMLLFPKEYEDMCKKNNSSFNKIQSSLKSFIFSLEFNYSAGNYGENKFGLSFNPDNADRHLKYRRRREEEKILELIKSKLKNPPKTLIFFDNIERLGSFSWEIIKLIQKLSVMENFIIIFPMDKNKLKVIDFDPNPQINFSNELYIEKYIQLKYYKLIQNYKNILIKFEFKDDYIQMINDLLETRGNDKFFSIREIERIFKDKIVKKAFDQGKYKGLKQLRIFFNPKEINDERIKLINELVKKDIFLILDFQSKISLWLDNLRKYIDKNENLRKFLTFCNIYHEIIKKDIDKLDEHFLRLIRSENEINCLGNLFFDWSTIIIIILNEITDIFNDQKINLNKIIFALDKKIKELCIEIDGAEKKRNNIMDIISKNQLVLTGINLNWYKINDLKNEAHELSKDIEIKLSSKEKEEELVSIFKFLKNNPINDDQLKEIKLFSDEFKEMKNDLLNNEDQKEIWNYIRDFNEKLIIENMAEVSLKRDELDNYVIGRILNEDNFDL